jgi:hypothetical protein
MFSVFTLSFHSILNYFFNRIISVVIAYFFSCWVLPVLLCYLNLSVVKLGKAVPKRNFAAQISSGRQVKAIRHEATTMHQSNALLEPPMENLYGNDSQNFGTGIDDGNRARMGSPSYRNSMEIYGDADRSDRDLDRDPFDDNFDDDDDFIVQKRRLE